MEQVSNMGSNQYRISVNYYANTVRIYEKALEVLGYPRFLQFLINTETKTFFLHGTNTRDINCIAVPSPEFRKRNCCVLHGKRFIKKICTLADWRLNMLHVLVGEYLPEYNMIAYPLAEALELESSSDYPM